MGYINQKKQIQIPDGFNLKTINDLLAKGYKTQEIAKYFNIGYDYYRRLLDHHNFKLNKLYWKYEVVEKDESALTIQEAGRNITGSLKALIDNQEALINVLSRQDELQALLDNQEELLDMLRMYQKNSSMLDPTITVELETKETITKTLRLNKKIYEEFEEFCKTHNQYRKQDLYSLAMKEYMELHI